MPQSFKNTSDYTPIAQMYDRTRDMPAELLAACFERIGRATGLDESWRVLDAGCGTGQLTVPLLAQGYEVVGIGVSDAMLDVAREKLRPGWRGTYAVADVRDLDFGDHAFDAVAVSKLLQHVGEWQSAVAEMVRVLRPGGVAVFVDEKGAFSHAVRRRFAQSCDERGFTNRSLGSRNRDTIAEEFARYDAERRTIDTTDLAWAKTLTYEECLDHLRQRLHSEFWRIPDEVYDEILAELTAEFAAAPGGLTESVELTPHLRTDVFTLPS